METVMIDVEMIVPCKGRLDDLKKSLMGFLTQRGIDYRILVVDYGCPEGTFDYCVSLRSPILRAVKVLDNTDVYNRSRARNCGAVHCDCPVLTFMDADIDLGPDWLRQAVAPVYAGDVRCTFPDLGDEGGCGLMTVGCFTYGVNRGYDESMQGWGFEDDDFFVRVSEGGKFAHAPGPPTLSLRMHDDALRVMYHDEKRKGLTHMRNQRLARNRLRVNPDGYGEGKFEKSWDQSKEETR